MGKIQKMIDYAVKIANDDSHGYSQARRFPSQGTDFDCSSLMYESAHQAGYSVPTSGARYTGTMVEHFKKAGFSVVEFDGDLDDLDPGDILVNVTYHTEMYIGNGRFVGAHGPEGEGVDGKPGDQTGEEISIVPAYVYWAGWDYVLVPPKEGTTVEKPKAASKLTDGAYVTTVDKVDVRSARKNSSTLCCMLAKGSKLQLRDVRANSAGNIWGEIASGDHKGRFVLVRTMSGTTRVKRK